MDFSVVRHHVPFLQDLTAEQLEEAVRLNKDNVPAKKYKEPVLQNVLPYLTKQSVLGRNDQPAHATYMAQIGSQMKIPEKQECNTHLDDKRQSILARGLHSPEEERGVIDGIRRSIAMAPQANQLPHETKGHSSHHALIELRLLFLEAVRHAYLHQISRGEMDGRGLLSVALLDSINSAALESSRGVPLNDWATTNVIEDGVWTIAVERAIHRVYSLDCRRGKDVRAMSPEFIEIRLDVKRALAFISAHIAAQKSLIEQFADRTHGEEFAMAEKVVLNESKVQVKKAQELLESYDNRDVQVIGSHLLCRILLNKAAR